MRHRPSPPPQKLRYIYFVSYSWGNGAGHGSGNTEIHMHLPIDSQKRVKEIEAEILRTTTWVDPISRAPIPRPIMVIVLFYHLLRVEKATEKQ